MEKIKPIITQEDILYALKDRYADIFKPLTTQKTEWEHGVRAGILQVLGDIESLSQ